MDLKELNLKYQGYLLDNRFPFVLESPVVAEILGKITITNYIKGIKQYKMYTLEFHYQGEIYYFYKMASEFSYHSRNVPICNGGIEHKSFSEMWGISNDEEHFFFKWLDNFICLYYEDIPSTITYREIDDEKKRQFDKYFGFLNQHPEFEKISIDGMDSGRYYHFTNGVISIGTHPLHKVYVTRATKNQETWFMDLLRKAEEARAKQKEDFVAAIKERSFLISNGIA